MKDEPTLFNADHPRRIDRYIDYFGGAGSIAKSDNPGSRAVADPCRDRAQGG